MTFNSFETHPYDLIMKNTVPDHLRVMRTAGWMWITYLVSLVVVDVGIYASKSAMPILWYHMINFFPP
jgi:hypothetical protein